MGNSYEQYRPAMEGPWPGWWIAWPPTQQISLGDVFERSGGVLRRAGSLASRHVEFATAREYLRPVSSTTPKGP